MPVLIKTLDQIAREKGRDVLYVSFSPPSADGGFSEFLASERREPGEWQALPVRQQIIGWLNDKGIAWLPCHPFIEGFAMLSGFPGGIYVDLPFDPGLPLYRELEDFLQYPDDSMRLEGAWFCYLPLEEAMKNAWKDDPDLADA